MNTESVSNEQLANYDFVVMIDKSGSMETKDCPGGKSRWQYAEEYAVSIATKCAEFDSDGIDVVLFAGQAKEFKGVTPEKVSQIFRENSPSGGTDTAAALKHVFDGYNIRKSAGNAKPIIIVCVTDGAPSDQEAVDRVIIEHTKGMGDDNETGIQFVQIGKDQAARTFLQYLDDGLEAKGAKFDIVDCKNEEEMENLSILDLLKSAIID